MKFVTCMKLVIQNVLWNKSQCLRGTKEGRSLQDSVMAHGLKQQIGVT